MHSPLSIPFSPLQLYFLYIFIDNENLSFFSQRNLERGDCYPDPYVTGVKADKRSSNDENNISDYDILILTKISIKV